MVRTPRGTREPDAGGGSRRPAPGGGPRQAEPSQYPSDPPAQSVPHPGLTGDLDPAPDHGEQGYRGSGSAPGGERALIAGVTAASAAPSRSRAPARAPTSRRLPARGAGGRPGDGAAGAGGRAHGPRVARRPPGRGLARVVERTAPSWAASTSSCTTPRTSDAPSTTDITNEQFDRVFKTNVYALFWLVKGGRPAPAAGRRASSSRASVEAYQPTPGLFDDAATEGRAWSTRPRRSRRRWRAGGSRVNTVAPGPIWTSLIPGRCPRTRSPPSGPRRRWRAPGQPVEVAAAFVLLASDEASCVTGERLGVHGGMALP